MNIRMLVISLVLCVSPSLYAMETYNLKDALELARNLGVRQEDITAITHTLLEESHIQGGNVLILKDTVYEAISNVLALRVMESSESSEQGAAALLSTASESTQTVTPLEDQPKASEIQLDSFDAQFRDKLADRSALLEVAREYDAHDEKENSLQTMQAISALDYSIEIELINRSKNKWFLTGSTRANKLCLMELQTVTTDSGLCVPHAIQSRVPLHHLVSHHQIFNSCGFNSLANAYALERQVKEGSSITAECTRKYAEYCFASTITSLGAFKNLLFDGGINFSEASELEAAARDMKRAFQLPLHVIYMSCAELPAFEDETTKLPIIELIKANPAVHFIVNIGGGHWVLVSVIQTKNTYSIYHLNSANDPIDEGQLAPVISYIDGLIVEAQK